MNDALRLGRKVKLLRKQQGLSQIDVASKLGISASYLNLIESNKRPLPATLLIKLARTFQVDLSTFASVEDSRLTADVSEVFGDPMFEAHGLTNVDVRELVQSSPQVARAALTLYQAYVGARDTSQALASKLEGVSTPEGGSTVPSESVSDFIQRNNNHFPALEEAAESLWREAKLDGDDVFAGLTRHLAKKHGVKVRIVRVADEREAMRRYDAERRLLSISEVLPPRSRRFQLAHQIGLIESSAVLDATVSANSDNLGTREAQSLARVALANYFAAALLMPYEPFLEAARAERYDIELLAHRFGASFEQVCHRLTTMHRRGKEGVPFHLLRIDMAGNISKRFSASGIRIARFSGACPRWNVHAAFLTPGMLRVQISRMPDDKVYFCIARTLRSDRGGYNVPHSVHAIGMGCEQRYARELVYSDGVDLSNLEAAVPVGVTCRLCEHLDCAQRAFPAMLHPLRIDENVRGVSFYAPVERK